MSSTRKILRWRTVLLVAAGWIGLNAVLIVVLDSFERRKWRPGQAVEESVLQAFEEVSVTLPARRDSSPRVVRYRLLRPADPVPGRKYPVVLFLHGAGEVGTDNRSQLHSLPQQMAREPWRSRYPCFFLAPQCPPNRRWSDQTGVLLATLDHVLKKQPADPRRVYLTGLSMGGFGSWNLATRYPERFAAVVPICGGGDPAQAERLVDVAIWAVHGDADEAVPVEHSRRMIRAIREAGGNPRYTELRGVGHDSWTAAYSDPDGVIAWMFQQTNTRLEEGGQEHTRRAASSEQ